MTFEEGLKAELEALPQVNKVYPIIAPKDGKPNFIVYRKVNRQFAKTLNGIMQNKVEAVYNLTVVTTGYASLQTLSNSVIELLSGFIGRAVAEIGPAVRNLTIESNEDQFDTSVDLYRSDIQFKVNYEGGI